MFMRLCRNASAALLPRSQKGDWLPSTERAALHGHSVPSLLATIVEPALQLVADIA